MHSPAREPAWHGQGRAVALAALYLVAYLVVSFIASLLVVGALLLLGLGTTLELAGIETRPLGLLIYGASVAGVTAMTWAFVTLFDRRHLADLGLWLAGPWARDLALGLLLGAGLMAIVFALEVGFGWYRLAAVGWQVARPGLVVERLAVAFALFVMVAFVEELVFRGYLFQSLEHGWGAMVALATSSILFAALHLLNQGAGLVSTLTLVVAGLLLGSAYLTTRALWLPIGLHFSWNFFQGPVFGFPVSGTDLMALLRLEPVGPPYLTGGRFGPEASLVGVGAEVLGIALLWLWARRRSAGR